MQLYASLTYVNDYIDNDFRVYDTWNGYSDVVKNRYLWTSQKKIDSISWIGDKVDFYQEESFPRDFEPFFTERSYDYDIIYKNNGGLIFEDLKKALAEVVIYYLRTANIPNWDLLHYNNVGSIDFKDYKMYIKTNAVKELAPAAYNYLKFYMKSYFNVLHTRS